MKNIKIRSILLLFVLTVTYFLIQICQTFFETRNLTSFNGVLMSFQFIACLAMVRREHKKGFILSAICIISSIIRVTIILLKTKSIGPLPGLFNSFIYLLTLTVLARLFFIIDKEAVTDYVTGLTNTRGFYHKIKEKINEGTPFYVIYIELENLKKINDNYGLLYCDNLLILLTQRIQQIVGNNGSIAKLGDAELVVILDSNSDCAKITQNLLDSISQKAEIETDGTIINSYITAFAGISQFPSDSRKAEELIKFANIAMTNSKKQLKNNFAFFDTTMEQQSLRRMEIEKFIKEGLANNNFYLVYQPQFFLKGKKLRGFETLLRLKTPDGTNISPAEFIPVAESDGLILKIDDYVLNRALTEYKETVLISKDLLISVNVSAKNISNPTFTDKIQAILNKIGFPPKNLEIEITEYCFVQSVEITIQNISKLKQMGIKIALDDFGTGYSSLSYLAKMPVNLLKIDKSLIDGIEENQKSRDFVNAVVSMGHLMGCEVISEGVETEQQLSILDNQACDFIQGYVWSKPLEYEISKKLALEN